MNSFPIYADEILSAPHVYICSSFIQIRTIFSFSSQKEIHLCFRTASLQVMRSNSLVPLRVYPARFGMRLVDLWAKMITDKHGMPELPDTVPTAAETFQTLDFSDMWEESNLKSVCHWLRGGKNLAIPPHFRDLLPKRLWGPAWVFAGQDRFCWNLSNLYP